MYRTSTIIFFDYSIADKTVIIPLPWRNEQPVFDEIPEPTLSLLKQAWDSFLASGEELIVKEELFPEVVPSPDFSGMRDTIAYTNEYPLVRQWYNSLEPIVRDPLQDAISKQNIDQVKYCLGQVLPTEESVLTELIDVCEKFNITIFD
jgi:hypothetical protein